MRRRDFITLLGGAAAAWPLAAHAQRTKTPQVGILDPGVSHLFAAFRQGMRDLGYIEAQNISYVYRSAEGRPEFVPRLASELAGLQLDVIVTAATLPVRAVKDATSTIPIVFAALGDAVATGAVTNLARPGGNITGLSFLNTEISAKRLGLLRETLPGARRVAVFSDPSVVRTFVEATEEAARDVGLELRVLEIPAPEALEGAFDAAVKWRADALNVLSSAFFNAQRVRIAELATKFRLPAMYESDEFVRAGGLMAYGASFYDLFRRAATYVDKILKGAKPGDLPVEQPTKFQLVINLKTARALGLTIPPTLLALANEVIE
jgi:putative tryptophan/tyrosine transport system substrate-binding protein